ncbi:hypothetical protein BOX37_20235 [Nocardia mangyaensis]|uniref:Uncharacterized protein n=1 Tax=Nocardia mangyaensis TaxID=2213200 RepID=A0A1J0VV32_9NOCA|nr:hypothetical protein [Nocardia mangyaensis]APE35885.1 hypothetical protein BOX37_20235 [Nocardia mangyaensis]
MNHAEHDESIGSMLASIAAALREVSEKLDIVAARVQQEVPTFPADDDLPDQTRIRRLETWAFHASQDISRLSSRLDALDGGDTEQPPPRARGTRSRREVREAAERAAAGLDDATGVGESPTPHQFHSAAGDRPPLERRQSPIRSTDHLGDPTWPLTTAPVPRTTATADPFGGAVNGHASGREEVGPLGGFGSGANGSAGGGDATTGEIAVSRHDSHGVGINGSSSITGGTRAAGGTAVLNGTAAAGNGPTGNGTSIVGGAAVPRTVAPEGATNANGAPVDGGTMAPGVSTDEHGAPTGGTIIASGPPGAFGSPVTGGDAVNGASATTGARSVAVTGSNVVNGTAVDSGAAWRDGEAQAAAANTSPALLDSAATPSVGGTATPTRTAPARLSVGNPAAPPNGNRAASSVRDSAAEPVDSPAPLSGGPTATPVIGNSAPPSGAGMSAPSISGSAVGGSERAVSLSTLGLDGSGPTASGPADSSAGDGDVLPGSAEVGHVVRGGQVVAGGTSAGAHTGTMNSPADAAVEASHRSADSGVERARPVGRAEAPQPNSGVAPVEEFGNPPYGSSSSVIGGGAIGQAAEMPDLGVGTGSGSEGLDRTVPDPRAAGLTAGTHTGTNGYAVNGFDHSAPMTDPPAGNTVNGIQWAFADDTTATLPTAVRNGHAHHGFTAEPDRRPETIFDEFTPRDRLTTGGTNTTAPSGPPARLAPPKEHSVAGQATGADPGSPASIAAPAPADPDTADPIPPTATDAAGITVTGTFRAFDIERAHVDKLQAMLDELKRSAGLPPSRHDVFGPPTTEPG